MLRYLTCLKVQPANATSQYCTSVHVAVFSTYTVYWYVAMRDGGGQTLVLLLASYAKNSNTQNEASQQAKWATRQTNYYGKLHTVIW